MLFELLAVLFIRGYFIFTDPFHLLAHWHDAVPYHQTASVVLSGFLYPAFLLTSLTVLFFLGSDLFFLQSALNLHRM
jgi:hypothetical protein